MGHTVGGGAPSAVAACVWPRGGIGLWPVVAGHGFPMGLLCVLKSPLIPKKQLAQRRAGGSVWGWL